LIFRIVIGATNTNLEDYFETVEPENENVEFSKNIFQISLNGTSASKE
jgi:hypothetical protein